MARVSHEWDITSFEHLVQIVRDNHENSKARRNAASASSGAPHQKLGDTEEPEGKGSSNRGSSCFGLSSWSSSSKARLSSSSGGSKSTLSQTCSGTLSCAAHKDGLTKKDVCAPTPSVCLIEKSEGSDRLTPLQQVKKAISATSNGFLVRMGSWGSKPCRRAQSFDTPPSAQAPPKQAEASTMSNPLHSRPPLSPGTGSRPLARQFKPGLSQSLNSRLPSSTDSMERRQIKSCLSRSLDRNTAKKVSFTLECGDAAGEGPEDLSSCARSSDCRPSSTYPSEGTPSYSGAPHGSDPPLSPKCSARSSSARSRSSAGTYFFQGTLGRTPRSSISDGTLPNPPTPEQRSEVGDGNTAQEQNPQVPEREGSRELEFYQFAKPFDLSLIGLEGEEATYACRPPGDEGDAAIVDQAGCVVRRVKTGGSRRARRNGYMLEAEKVERNCAKVGMASTESWPVQLANAIVAIPPRSTE